MRRALVGYLRWSRGRHWAVKLLTLILVMPVYLFSPARWFADVVEEAFGRTW